MRVRREARSGAHVIVVRDEQEAVMGVARIVVPAEGEAVVRVEPAGPGVEPLRRSPDVDHSRAIMAADFVSGRGSHSTLRSREMGDGTVRRRDRHA
jgi:hypothetical protein